MRFQPMVLAKKRTWKNSRRKCWGFGQIAGSVALQVMIAEMYASVRRKISGTERQRAAAVSAMKPDRKICARQFTLWTEPAWSASRAERPASTTPAVTAVYIGDPTEPGGPASDFREKSTILGPSLRLMRRCRRG